MKLSRPQFKKILKECIMELIDEGAFNKVVQENLQAQPTQQRRPVNDFVSSAAEEQPSFGGPAGPQVGQHSPNERLNELAKEAAQVTSKGDKKQASVLEGIFADTAKTTLQNQLGSEMGGGMGAGMGAEMGVGASATNGMYVGEQSDPETQQTDDAQLEALSGGKGASHWAKLAFGAYEKDRK